LLRDRVDLCERLHHVRVVKRARPQDPEGAFAAAVNAEDTDETLGTANPPLASTAVRFYPCVAWLDGTGELYVLNFEQ
jgi:hypothetical protein